MGYISKGILTFHLAESSDYSLHFRQIANAFAGNDSI